MAGKDKVEQLVTAAKQAQAAKEKANKVLSDLRTGARALIDMGFVEGEDKKTLEEIFPKRTRNRQPKA